MIETSNQSHCGEHRADRGLLPAVTLLSVPVSHFFPRTWIDRRGGAAWRFLAHTLTRLLNPLCDNLCHAGVYHTVDKGEKLSLLHWLYFQ